MAQSMITSVTVIYLAGVTDTVQVSDTCSESINDTVGHTVIDTVSVIVISQ